MARPSGRSARQGLTQKTLAAAAGMTRRYVAGIERGELNVGVENLLQLLDAMDTTLERVAAEAGI